MLSVVWGSATDPGRVRASNEDNFFAQPPVFVVADGMGGHAAGEVASALAVDAFSALSRSAAVANDDVAAALRHANARVLDAAGGGAEGMGTTIVGLAMVQSGGADHWLVFNVGDSRAYRLIHGDFEQVSVDHSEVQELVAAGHISAQAARIDRRRHIVTRAIGSLPAPEPDLWLLPPVVGERFLLCSDGLSAELTDDAISECLLTHGDAQVAATRLVEMALAAGGRDNVTVIVVDVLAVDDQASVNEVTEPRSLALS